MNVHDTAEIKQRIKRRIGLRTVLFAIWIGGLAAVAFGKETALANESYFYMMVAIAAVWIVYLIRDLRYLKNEELLRKQAIERADERTILITYKATRIAAVILLCALPVAICVLSLLDMQMAVDTLAGAAAFFALAYLAAWFYFSKTC